MHFVISSSQTIYVKIFHYKKPRKQWWRRIQILQFNVERRISVRTYLTTYRVATYFLDEMAMQFGPERQNVNRSINPALDWVNIPFLFLCQFEKRLFMLRGGEGVQCTKSGKWWTTIMSQTEQLILVESFSCIAKDHTPNWSSKTMLLWTILPSLKKDGGISIFEDVGTKNWDRVNACRFAGVAFLTAPSGDNIRPSKTAFLQKTYNLWIMQSKLVTKYELRRPPVELWG